MGIDAVVRKAEGENKRVNVPPPKATRAKLYKDACGGMGDILQIMGKRTSDQMKDAPFWTKTEWKDNSLQLPPAAPHYQDLKQKPTYDTMYPRPLMTQPAIPVSTLAAGIRTGTDPRTLPKRSMFRDPKFTVPEAEPQVDEKATTWGPQEGKRWVARVGYGNGPGFAADITTSSVDWAKMTKRRNDSKAAYRLIRDRGRNSALDALFSNVCD
jgi:hypothetical protein